MAKVYQTYSPIVAPKGSKTFIDIWTFYILITYPFIGASNIVSTGGKEAINDTKSVGYTHGGAKMP